MIRQATEADLDTVLDLGAQFLAMGPYGWMGLDREAFAGFVRHMLSGAGAVFLSEEGMIGGLLTPAFFNPAVSMAAELFWYAPKDGRALRQAFEAWARERGAAVLTCSGLVNEREPVIRRLYQRAGYEPAEIAFVKRL